MTGKIMPLREPDTSTVQAAADAFLSSPRYANRNTRRGYADNAGHWRFATDSDSSPVARTRADMVGDLVADMAACAAPERDVLRS